jgi:hypothetical protein
MGPGPGGAGIPDVNGDVNVSFNQEGCNSISEILEGPAINPFETIPGGPVTQGSIIDIEGVASDIGRGDSNVINVEYAVDFGPWTGATPVDGNFDSPTEAFQGFVDTSALEIGTHTVCARAEDALGNLGQRCILFEVVEGAIDGEWMIVCRHVPLWPQPGETVQIRMLVTERPEGNELTSVLAADRLEIWLDDDTMPIDFTETPGTSFFSYTSEELSAGTFSYGCRARIGDLSIFSGWRSVAVGAPAGNGAIPVTYTGLPSGRLDIVFVADGDDYPGGSSDPDFLTEANRVIRDAFYEYGYYNRYQHLFNFWISRNTGHAERSSDAGDAVKTIEKPSDWDENYSFAQTGAIIHTRNFREFARDGFFTIEVGERANTSSHELGHRAFGLSDEYCCDSGYYERELFPNVYETLAACEADAPNLGRVPGDCRTWDKLDEMGMTVSTWYSSEPTPNDLMNGDQTPPQAADKRRIDWFFERCETEGC